MSVTSKNARHPVVQNKNTKKALRDVQRLLKKPNLPADVRVEQERKLKSLTLSLQDKSLAEKERKNAKRYHMVKFFDKTKVLRKLKQALKSGDNEKLVNELKGQLNYVVHFPKSEKYISLYPKVPCTDEKVLSKQKEILADITAKVEKKALPDAVEGHFRTKFVDPKEVNTEDDDDEEDFYEDDDNDDGDDDENNEDDDEEDDEDGDDDDQGDGGNVPPKKSGEDDDEDEEDESTDFSYDESEEDESESESESEIDNDEDDDDESDEDDDGNHKRKNTAGTSSSNKATRR